MMGKIRILVAMAYGAVVAVTAMVSQSHTGVVAVAGAILLGAFYVATRPRRDSPR